MYPRPAGDDAGPCALQVVTLGAELRERGIGLHVIEQDTGTGTMQGRATARTRGRMGPIRHRRNSCRPMPDGASWPRARVEGGHVARLAPTDAVHTQGGAEDRQLVRLHRYRRRSNRKPGERTDRCKGHVIAPDHLIVRAKQNNQSVSVQAAGIESGGHAISTTRACRCAYCGVIRRPSRIPPQRVAGLRECDG